MAWGTPAAALLSNDFQEVVTQLGYLGLIAMIFEGEGACYKRIGIAQVKSAQFLSEAKEEYIQIV